MAQSHIDTSKLERVPSGKRFEYRDIVSDEFPIEQHTVDGTLFKDEVENGVYDNVTVLRSTESHMLYKKL